jgi:hypothetical protein
MKMKWKAGVGFVVVAVACLLLAGQVQAAPVTSIWFSGEQNQSSDNDADFLVNQIDPATGMPFTDSTLDVGDVLVTVSNFFTNEDLTGGGGTELYGAGGVNELSVIALIEVATKTPTLSPALFDFTFSPLTATGVAALGFHASLAAISAEYATWAAGTMIAAFDDPLIDYTRLGADDGVPIVEIGDGPFAAEAGLVATAMNGTKILELGFTGAGGLFGGGAGEGWRANGAAGDISLFSTVGPGTPIGTFNFGLNVTANFLPLWQFGTVANIPLFLGGVGGTSQFAGGGSVLGVMGVVTPYDAWSNLDVTFAPSIIPEPSTLTLWSLGALALAGMGWRRRNRTR